MNSLWKRTLNMHQNIRDYEDHEELLHEFAELNNLKRTRRDFKMSALDRGQHGGGDDPEYGIQWQGGDHLSFFMRDGKAAAIITEPYSHLHQALLRATSFGLVCHMPPNPFASLWFPGWTFFVVITRRDFGDVVWLPDQLSFIKPPPRPSET